MLDCLIITVKHFADSVGLPAIGHLEKNDTPFLATRVLYSKATHSKEHSRSRCTEHSLQHFGLSVAHEVYLQSLFENSTALE